jgi:hypothetical protein
MSMRKRKIWRKVVTPSALRESVEFVAPIEISYSPEARGTACGDHQGSVITRPVI